MMEGYRVRCPSCGNESMSETHTQYEVDHFGSVLLSVSTCGRCGYKHSDVMMLAEREPTVITAKVNSIEDLNIRVIKSGTATIKIPEFGATITPGPYSEGYLSNVEGVLQRVEDALTFMLSSAKGNKLKKGEKMLKSIRKAKEIKPHFTLIIKDPFGNSALVSPNPRKIKTRKLTNRELSSTKFGEYILEPRTQH
jgi:zinc finger protein